MANGNNNGRSSERVWNCDFCHATNVHQGVCGCGESRRVHGRELPAVDINSIEIELPKRPRPKFARLSW